MEDAHFHEDGFGGVSHQGFFCIYDGHGGKEAAVFASNTLHNVFILFFFFNSSKMLKYLDFKQTL